MQPNGGVNSPTTQRVCVWWRESSKVVLTARGRAGRTSGACEAGVRTGGRKLEGSKRETDRNGSAYPALLVEYDDVLAFFPRVCYVF